MTDIFDYIAVSDPQAALRLLQRFQHTMELACKRPFIGPKAAIPGVIDLRKITVMPYLLFYRITDRELQIVRVLHSSRNIDAKLLRVP